jgi:hypothetical protein
MEKQLSLSKEMMEPSRAGLYRFGNVSSTSIWYVLAYIETFRGVKAGDKVWQLGFGSGFKCNSAVWRANRTLPKVSSTLQQRSSREYKRSSSSIWRYKCIGCTLQQRY